MLFFRVFVDQFYHRGMKGDGDCGGFAHNSDEELRLWKGWEGFGRIGTDLLNG